MEISESTLLTLVGLIGGGLSTLLVFFLKSRCRTVKCGCLSCERDVVALTVKDTTLNRV